VTTAVELGPTADLSQKHLQVIALVLGGVIIAVLGALDDTRGLRARTRLLERREISSKIAREIFKI
jgi:UDP-N-acetylmuramyl pentapeptide phosphotransferase/UDP-N-acetylglucosamine-1-phosphate transferase